MGVIAFCIVMQGLIEVMRRIRVISPWTYFGGPSGRPATRNACCSYTGSPYWWVPYLACLCGLGADRALLHDREQPRRRLWQAAASSARSRW